MTIKFGIWQVDVTYSSQAFPWTFWATTTLKPQLTTLLLDTSANCLSTRPRGIAMPSLSWNTKSTRKASFTCQTSTTSTPTLYTLTLLRTNQFKESHMLLRDFQPKREFLYLMTVLQVSWQGLLTGVKLIWPMHMLRKTVGFQGWR